MAQAATASRDRMLDGIRGYAIVLVLLSHSWIVTPSVDWTSVRWLFASGNYAVTIFFVVSGFLATRSMLREQDATGTLRPAVAWLRRWIRISAHVYPLVVVVLALTAVNWQMLVAYQGTDTRTSAFRIVTYTWNGYVREHAASARPDLGHLWYVCTDLWGIGLILLVVFLVGRRRLVLLATLVALLAVVMIYRQHVYDTEGVFSALIRVQTRVDGLLWGALTAVVLPWLGPWRRYASVAMVASTFALVPLMGAVVEESGYFGFGGVLLNIDVAVFVLAAALVTPPAVLRRTVGWRPLVLAGRYSLVLYIWHYPIFWFCAKNYGDWSWQATTAVAYGATLVVAILAQVLIERRAQAWLASEKWHAFDHGIGSALLDGSRLVRDTVYERWHDLRSPGATTDEPVPVTPADPRPSERSQV